tara:strand:- start:1782 stop:2519 length:738 start_codon:yes stop_codon:yes gene_type:complete
MKLVSVIIPYFKKKKYIADTLNSVLNQTYNNLEVIIVYDDPQKTDLDYIKKLALSDQRVKLTINNTNIGAGRSRNIAIDQSKGMLLAFVDADDLWSKNKLEEQIKFMQDQAISFCHTSYKIINEKNEFISIRKARNFMDIDDLIKSCDIGLSTVLIEKEALGSNKFPDLKTKEDFVLWLKLLSKNIRIYGLDKELAIWRKNNNSLSSSLFQKIFDGYKVYNVYMKYNMIKSIYYLLCLSINFLKK